MISEVRGHTPQTKPLLGYPAGIFIENWHKPVLLTLSDPRGGVLTLPDTRTAAHKGL